MLVLRYFLFVTMVLFISACTDIRKKTIETNQKNTDMQEIVEPPLENLPLQKNYKQKKKEKIIPKKFMKPVSISINEKTPIKQVLIALSEQAQVDLQLDPSIDVTLLYQATNTPFYTVIQNICDMTKLRFKLEGNTIRIEPDTPFTKSYNLQFLNIERQSNNRISTATDVFNSKNQTSLDSSDNSSNSEVKVQGHNSFWNEVEENIKIILHSNEHASQYAIHKQAGLITISGTQKQHELIDDYISTLKHVSSRQVLIEAKIIEVQLKEAYKSGINWQNVQSQGLNLGANFADLSNKGFFSDMAFNQKQGVSVGKNGSPFSAILNILEEFGTSKTLSSPRLTVMNNQIAVLKVAQNKVYFKLNYDKQMSTNNNFQNFSLSSDVQTVPIGLVMSVQASIDDETGDVILCLRPTVSKFSHTEQDPAVDIAYANAQNAGAIPNDAKPSLIPVVDVKEIDSVLRVKSGEIAILGGLMECRSTSDSTGFPGLKNISFLKDIFSAESQSDQVIELVILLKVTIVDQSSPHAADKRLAKKYVKDSRPF
jgi:MSHA type pilus biogenesis protein MshL